MAYLQRFGLLLALASMAAFDPGTTLAQGAVPKPDSSSGGLTTPKVTSGEAQTALKDPQQRRQLRARERVNLERRLPELARILRLEPAIAERLLELLTEQRMATLDRAGDPAAYSSSRGAVTREFESIRSLLGADAYRRYLDYLYTLSQRQQAAMLAERLQQSEPLSSAKRDRLVAVLVEERDRARERDWLVVGHFDVDAFRSRFRPPGLLSAHNGLRHRDQLSAAVQRRLPEFLSPAQCAAFASIEAREIAVVRQKLLRLRKQSRLNADVTDLPDLRALVPLSTEVKLSFEVEINGVRSGQLVRATRHGRPLSFAAPEGLRGELIAFYYEGDYMVVRFRFFEATPQGRRMVLEYPNHPFDLQIAHSIQGFSAFGGSQESSMQPYSLGVTYGVAGLELKLPGGP